MKHKLIFLVFLIFCISCGESGGGSSKKKTVAENRSFVVYSHQPSYYEGFKLYDDGDFEYFATTAVTVGGTVTVTGWYLVTGTYTMDGSTLSLNGKYTAKNTNIVNCDAPLVADIPYTETATSITLAPHTYTLESVSGLTRPSVSSFPDECL